VLKENPAIVQGRSYRARTGKIIRVVTAVVKGGKKLRKDNKSPDRPAEETFRENKQKER
jgi:hypothetical protein